MDIEIIKQSIDSITKKLGDEAAATIADDLGLIQVSVNEASENFAKKDEQIKQLETTNGQLVAANAGLLRRVPINDENKLVPRSEPSEAAERQYVDPFDEWGKLKR